MALVAHSGTYGCLAADNGGDAILAWVHGSAAEFVHLPIKSRRPAEKYNPYVPPPPFFLSLCSAGLSDADCTPALRVPPRPSAASTPASALFEGQRGHGGPSFY